MEVILVFAQAMNIISKEKKEIRWLGLPTNSVQEANSMEQEKAEKLEKIKVKTKQLQDLILQQIAFKVRVLKQWPAYLPWKEVMTNLIFSC